MNDKIDWSDWYNHTRVQPPYDLLNKALSYVKNMGKALDVGGGALKDTRYLLEKGFDVTVIDKSPLLEKEAEKIKSDRLHTYVTSFENFDFPVNEYVLASAMHSLSYCEPEHFNRVFINIKSSLKKGGIFCGHLYDTYDEWSKGINRAYQTANGAKELLKDMDVILFQEEETEGDHTKHWRIYDFIARKL
jgi:tellurite methyltransferase